MQARSWPFLDSNKKKIKTYSLVKYCENSKPVKVFCLWCTFIYIYIDRCPIPVKVVWDTCTSKLHRRCSVKLFVKCSTTCTFNWDILHTTTDQNNMLAYLKKELKNLFSGNTNQNGDVFFYIL